MKTIHSALVELAKRVPANLDQEKEFAKDGAMAAYIFEDDHEFSIRVPAWVLRKVKMHYSPMNKKF